MDGCKQIFLFKLANGETVDEKSWVQVEHSIFVDYCLGYVKNK